MPVYAYIYDGPKHIKELKCRSCSHVLGTNLAIKQSPSQNLGDILDLWQCHEEDYSRMIEKNGELKIPQDTLLFNINVLEVKNQKIDINEGLECIKCS
jgi:hypothetical protein